MDYLYLTHRKIRVASFAISLQIVYACLSQLLVYHPTDLSVVSGISEEEGLQFEAGNFDYAKQAWGERLILPLAAGRLTVLLAEEQTQTTA